MNGDAPAAATNVKVVNPRPRQRHVPSKLPAELAHRSGDVDAVGRTIQASALSVPCNRSRAGQPNRPVWDTVK
jgi:hypothetical protein